MAVVESLPRQPSKLQGDEDSRTFVTKAPLRAAPAPRPKSGGRCEECERGPPHVMVEKRRCTGGTMLCSHCRALPEHRIMSEACVRRTVSWLPQDSYPPHVGTIVNCVRPCFRRQRVYAWGDVAAECARRGLPLPE